MFSVVIVAVIILSALAFWLGRSRSLAAAGGRESALHSRPGYYGAYAAAWVGIPATLLALIWIFLQASVIDRLLVTSLPAERLAGLTEAQVGLVLSEIRQVARGNIFGQPDDAIREAAARYLSWQTMAQWAMFAAAMALAVAGMLLALRQIKPTFRARQGVERVLSGFMIVCSIIAILTTLGIILSLALEALRFFKVVSPVDFFTGLAWEPQIALRADQSLSGGAFGAIPVFLGTLVVALVAMVVAIPIGLYTAIYLAEYASPTVRAIVKPVIEILAGIPTVVYGFFAVLTVAPFMRQLGTAMGIEIAPNSALAAGGVMGIMIIPFISSFADDALAAVPRSLRDGSYALGATRGETITRVLLPAAIPGIMGGILLAVSRAIGETMIVVMAAGIIANLTVNPAEPMTTVTVQIVTLLIGDTEFDSPKTLAAFALGLVLFLVTLCLNIIALGIVRKYRERYE